MKKKGCLFGIAIAALLLASCASQFALTTSQQTCAEATALKNTCSKLLQDAGERRVADSLYNQGANLIRTGYNEKAYQLLSRVIVRYRLILERQAVAGKEQEINLLKQELAKDLHELSSCERTLAELEPAVKP